ncbi:MAG: hypothetical protein HUJ54_09455 [Erysipelotrichaceae bacterium]|nr:hypothetical protein [Erysipelotrichaceae bacterium]MCF0260071.1 hypothetical protein [Erysipelotrichaceae bacterium]
MRKEILDATAAYQPAVYDIDNKGDYWFESEEDFVIDFNEDLMVSFSKSYGTCLVSHKDWTRGSDHPIRVLLMILEGDAELAEMANGMPALVIVDNEMRNKIPGIYSEPMLNETDSEMLS